ncbi:MAG: DUF3488 domain-containing transglutaminase family protein, partial [Nitrospirae bacterium]|nr:DUF3488 domain-containing transglutaminase family protein [Nitrospirota bacterium]
MNTTVSQGDTRLKDEGLKQENRIKVEAVLKAVSYAIAFTGFLSIAGQVGIIFSSVFLALVIAAVFIDFKNSPGPREEGNASSPAPEGVTPMSPSSSVSSHVPRWVVNTLSIIIISLSFYRLYTKDFVDTTVEAILLLTAVKFLEEKKFRDYMQIYIMSVFMLAGSALMSIDLMFLFYFMILFPLTSTAIVILTYETEFPGLRLKRSDLSKIVLRALLIPLMSIPLSAVIFVILPRTNFHFLGFLNRAGIGRAGFTDNVNLGEVSSIQLDTSVIFRAQMERLNETQLYWRGIVFDEFDGTSWKSVDRDSLRNMQESRPKGKRVNQTIYLEPYDNRYLFTLDMPVYVSGTGTYLSKNYTVRYLRNINSTMRYDVVSVLPESYPASANDAAKDKGLPGNFSPAIINLAKSLTTGNTQRQAITTIFNYLHNGRFRYALDKLPVSSKPLEEFLFKSRYGNCEYFASAMAVMLRSIEIPARLVGG